MAHVIVNPFSCACDNLEKKSAQIRRSITAAILTLDTSTICNTN